MTVLRTVGRWLLAALAIQALPVGSGSQETGAQETATQETATQETATQETAALDVNLLEGRIAEAVRGKAGLAGAWLFVTVDDRGDLASPPRKFVFRRVLDRARAAQQRRELERLIKGWLPKGRYWVDAARDREYPFSQLMADLRIRVETDPLLGGCAIAGGYYAPDPNEADKLNLVLRGRIAKEGQDVEIEGLCGRLMRAEGAWIKPAAEGGEAAADGGAAGGVELPLAISPKSSELNVVEPSESHGRLFYSNGLNAFRRQQYAAAADAFGQAALESPRKLVYYYWWTLADLAAGERRMAALRMRTVVKRFRESDFDHQSSEYRDVVRSLERVQGPLRRALLELESRALFADSQTRAK